MRATRRLAAVLLAGAAAGCAEPPPPERPMPEGLEGVLWGLETLDGEAAPPGATLAFAGDKVRGAGLCNRFFGAFERRDGGIVIGPIAATRRACPNLETEQRFLGALTDVRSYAMEDGRLALIGDGGVTLMTFRP